MRFRHRVAGLAVLAAALFALPALSQTGPPGGRIYADDQLFHTVGTPADLPDRGPFNVLYMLGDGFTPVSDAAPGDPNWRGGRWEVRAITFVNVAPAQYTNGADIQAALGRGDLTLGPVLRRFECPLIRDHGR